MVGIDDIVISGIGAVTPIGIGRESLLQSLVSGRCNSRPLFLLSREPQRLVGSSIDGFDGQHYIQPRKAIKMMSREVQIAYASARLAWQDAGLVESQADPERVGVIFGSEMIPGDHAEIVEAVQACGRSHDFDSARWGQHFSKSIYPLWMLRNLPNMPACHVAIAVDARGPNNTLVVEEVSGLLALAEAISVIERGQADRMIVGAVGSRITATRLMYRKPGAYFDASATNAPEQWHSRAFDQASCGIVPAETAITLVVERRRHAVARKATVYGQVSSIVSRFGAPDNAIGGNRQALSNAAHAALQLAGILPRDLAVISAQGFSHPQLDQMEADAISTLGADAPVTAYSSYLGTAGAASGLAQLSAAVLAMRAGKVLPILGFTAQGVAPQINVCHRAVSLQQQTHLLQLSYSLAGQTVAVVVDC